MICVPLSLAECVEFVACSTFAQSTVVIFILSLVIDMPCTYKSIVVSKVVYCGRASEEVDVERVTLVISNDYYDFLRDADLVSLIWYPTNEIYISHFHFPFNFAWYETIFACVAIFWYNICPTIFHIRSSLSLSDIIH